MFFYHGFAFFGLLRALQYGIGLDWAIDCSIWLKCDTSLSMLSIEQYCKVLKVLSVLGCQSKKEHLGTFPYPASNETW